MAITSDDLSESWTNAVTRFMAASEWLNDTHLPQLKALFAIAQRLDAPGEWNAALVAQFTLCQRTLAGKAPGVDDDDEAGNDGLTGGTLPPPMF